MGPHHFSCYPPNRAGANVVFQDPRFLAQGKSQDLTPSFLVTEGVDAQRIAASIRDGWLVVEAHARESVPLTPSLGLGESDSIRLALEDREHSLLIMDDRLARRYALRKGLNIVGSVRLLDMAERRGLMQSAQGCIRQMSDFGYRVSVDLLDQIRSS